MQVSAELQVDRPARDVWSFITNVANYDVWAPDASNPRQTSGGPFGLGTTFALDYTFQGKPYEIEGQVVEFEPPHHLGLRNRGGPMPMDERFDLMDDDSGVTLRHTNDFQPEATGWKIAFTVLRPLMRSMMRREMSKELRSLKAHLESRPEVESTSR